jgi:hypothetical protein
MVTTPKPTALAAAVAAALGTVMVAPASALTVTTSPSTFNISGSVIDGEAAGSTSTTVIGSTTVGEFDSALGVLTDATINVTSTRTQTVTVTAAASGSSTTQFTASGSGSSTATKISAAGVSGTFTDISSATATCKAQDKKGCSASTITGPVATGGTFTVGSLDSYVGTGNETISFTATVAATQGTGTFTGAETTTTGLKWATGTGGGVSATYEYLLHAAPSFDSGSPLLTLNLDFGTLYLGEDAAQQTFSIFNPAGERVGLDLDSLTPGGDTSAFTTNLGLFSALAAGDSQSFWFDLVTSTLGDFSASYSLSFSDADVGAASSRFAFTGYVINLTGRVIERPGGGPAPVPAPGLIGLLGGGLLALGLARRKRNG